MTPEEVKARIAKPGDPDLDLDVDGLTLNAVVVGPNQQVLLWLTGGFGRFVDSRSGAWFVRLPGEPEAEIHTVQMAIGVPDMPPAAFAAYIARFTRWRDTAVPLRLCAAPGRLMTLIEDRDQFVVIPRRPFPSEGAPR